MASHENFIEKNLNQLVISHYKPFWKCVASDIIGGRVHLGVWRIDEQRLLQSTGWAGRLIYPAHIQVDTPTCDVRSGTFSKRLVRAHTWWYDMSPLTPCGLLTIKVLTTHLPPINQRRPCWWNIHRLICIRFSQENSARWLVVDVCGSSFSPAAHSFLLCICSFDLMCLPAALHALCCAY